MKKAAIVIGKQSAGKSTTIKKFKALVDMDGDHKFNLNGKIGFLLSCSMEERGLDPEKTIDKRQDYDLLVLACRGPELDALHDALRERNFSIKDFKVQRESGDFEAHKEESAKGILRFFSSN